ncbi:MAG: FixH family protein [Bacteroidales bacterium]|nr:FixH family protein [Bacteroidales bacterium]
MKFHWGHAIFLVIIIFLAAMTWIIVFAFSQKVNLVTPEYYPKGVDYEEQIDKVRNTAKLNHKIRFEKQNDKLVFIFPDEMNTDSISGNIQFYYITDFEKDRNIAIEIDTTGKQEIDIKNFLSGRYIIKIDWAIKSTGYYQEFDINL